MVIPICHHIWCPSKPVWVNFMGSFIYEQSMDNFTLAIGLNLFKTQYTQNWNYTMAYICQTEDKIYLLISCSMD